MTDGVVVTGDGCVSALGAGVPENMAGLYAGRVQPPGTGPLASTVRPPPPVFWVEKDPECEGADLSRTSKLALGAAREALAASWGGRPAAAAERIGVCFGTTAGCTFNDELFYRELRLGNAPPPDPMRLYLRNDVSRVLAREIGARGPVLTIVNACASGTDAIGRAAAWIAAGLCDVVLAGGADELTRFAYLGFISLKNVSPERCAPFDLNRKGLNLGEGAAALVLERESAARRRGARLLGRVAGYASYADAHHPTAPHPEGRGLRRAIARALEVARAAPAEIGFVNAHGTGTSENDRIEGQALATLFPQGLPVFSTKGCTGHTTGAAGAMEALFTLRNLADRRIPASAGFRTPDPRCGLTPTTTTRAIDARLALSTSLAFGGSNSALVLGAGDPE